MSENFMFDIPVAVSDSTPSSPNKGVRSGGVRGVGVDSFVVTNAIKMDLINTLSNFDETVVYYLYFNYKLDRRRFFTDQLESPDSCLNFRRLESFFTLDSRSLILQ